jgi:hypothetical protein
VANPIFESRLYRRDLAEARALEKELRLRFPDVVDARLVVGGAGLDHTQIAMAGSPSAIWAAIFDFAAKLLELQKLLESVERQLRPAPKDAEVRAAIESVRRVAQADGSLSPMRLLLRGDSPFLGRTTLRGFVPELRNWNSSASILVVRGEADSGRTETQLLLDEGRDEAREMSTLLDEQMPLQSTMRAIWKSAGAAGEAPKLDSKETLTTESAVLIDFWTDVRQALHDKDRLLWVLFDDLDKGAGRSAVRLLAEVLAIRLTDVSFQRRIRLVMLGYPDPQLPAKVTAKLVRNDTIEPIDDSHVRAFVDYCAKTAGKNLADTATTATDICTKAKAKTSNVVPYLEALNGELRTWYQGL